MSSDDESGATGTHAAAHNVEFHQHVIPTERCGALNVWVQGDLSLARKEGKEQYPVFLTVHDIGMNHNSFESFINHPAMFSIKMRAIFIHVDLMGQEDNAPDMPEGKFPTLQEIGEDLVNILDVLQIKCVIGVGEGAGSNIIIRFGMMHVTRCLGIICINPTVGTTSVMEHIKDKLSGLKLSRLLSTEEKPPKLTRSMSQENDDGEPVDSTKLMNKKNIKNYVMAFQNREDLTGKVSSHLTCDTLLVTGSQNATYVTNTEALFQLCDKTKTSLLKIDNVKDVVAEAPAKLANAILLFVKGLGWLTSVTLPNIERRSSKDRRMSMEEYDKPNIRRLSLTGAE